MSMASVQNGKLDNKKIIVTGGSRGIGKAIVHALAKEGAHILFTRDAVKPLPSGMGI